MNTHIISTIIIGFGSWFAWKIADLIFDKILTPYIPERKKLISIIKKCFLFIALYLIPILAIIVSIISDDKIDKWFVLNLCFLFFLLSINISIFFLHQLKDGLFKIINTLRESVELHKIHSARATHIQNQLETKKDKKKNI